MCIRDSLLQGREGSHFTSSETSVHLAQDLRPPRPSHSHTLSKASTHLVRAIRPPRPIPPVSCPSPPHISFTSPPIPSEALLGTPFVGRSSHPSTTGGTR